MKYIVLLLLLFPYPLFANELPMTLKQWEQRGAHFDDLDFTDEAKLKSGLKTLFSNIYAGELLNKLNQWIEQGTINSDYYSSFFDDIKDTQYALPIKISKNKYLIRAKRKSCYEDSRMPNPGTLALDYKVSNCTQEEIDNWYNSVVVMAYICIDIDKQVELTVDATSKKIIAEKHRLKSSTVDLAEIESPFETNKWCNKR